MNRRRKQWCVLAGMVVAGSGAFGEAQQPAESDAKPAPTMRRAFEWKKFGYTCEGGTKLVVYLHDETIKLGFRDKTYLMKQVMSGSGTRYSDGKVVWWSKGNGGFLQEDAPDGNGAMIVKGCELDQPLNGGAAAGSVTGTVSYAQRIALPANAVIQVQLLDVSLADAPVTVVAEEKIVLGEQQVPVAFELKFDAGKINVRHAYSVSAKILVDGQVRFVSDKRYAVLTQGNGARAEMVLVVAGK